MSTTDGYLAGLYYGDKEDYANSTTFTEVTGCTDIQPPTTEVEDIDTSHLKTADRHRTFKGGWRDSGEVTAVVQYTAAQYKTLAGIVGESKGWKVLFADDTDASTHDGGVGFDGYLKSLGQPLEADGLVTVSLTIKVSGKPTVIDPDTGA